VTTAALPQPLPTRAAGTQLLGALAGSGYREPPTLVRRGDGQLIRLTPLLYEVIDALDGRQGYEELATELGRRVGKQVTSGDVRFLIERKLRPLGLLQQPDGTQLELVRSRPLLAMRPRFVISKPAVTSMLTAPFTWLFRPLVATPLLLTFLAIGAWLLVEKGLASALHQAFYEPGLILVVWAMVVLGAAFHEIGHAAACRYGGATPGAIGGGLYLVWPAFYTDVSDAYRLSRRARLRVDLGGLYFSAIVAVATAGLWRVTGDDALLLVIAVQLLQMVRQMAPFIRADGYHVVADLIGVPDLFAHIKPTLLGVLPGRLGRPQHQALKPWARSVVTGWVLLTVPALAVVLVMIVLSFPRLAATAWDSVGHRWEEATTYWGAGNPAGTAVSAISIALVALPVLSVSYVVWSISKRTARRTWRETSGRPRLRALAMLGGAAVLAFLAWAWWPGDQYRPISARERGRVPTMLTPLGPNEAAVQAPRRSARVRVTRAARGTVPVRRTNRALILPPRIPPSGPNGRRGTVPPPPAGGNEDRGRRQRRQPDPPRPPAPVRPALAPSLTQPSSTAADGPPAWPFPFDPPAPTKPGDNRAMAVNTRDGSKQWDFAFSLVHSDDGHPVRNANEAHAYARCIGCKTGAFAFQVVLIVGQADEIVPRNAAVAANYQCRACDTYAFAYQVVASVTETPGPAVERALSLVIEHLRELETNADSRTPAEILRALQQARTGVLAALEGILAHVSPADEASLETSEAHDETEAAGAPSPGLPDAPRDGELNPVESPAG